MSRATIRLDRFAYDLLRSRRRPGESFSEEIHRLLGAPSPELKEFLTLLTPRDAAEVADAVGAARTEDLEFERHRANPRHRRNGRRA